MWAPVSEFYISNNLPCISDAIFAQYFLQLPLKHYGRTKNIQIEKMKRLFSKHTSGDLYIFFHKSSDCSIIVKHYMSIGFFVLSIEWWKRRQARLSLVMWTDTRMTQRLATFVEVGECQQSIVKIIYWLPSALWGPIFVQMGVKECSSMHNKMLL